MARALVSPAVPLVATAAVLAPLSLPPDALLVPVMTVGAGAVPDGVLLSLLPASRGRPMATADQALLLGTKS